MSENGNINNHNKGQRPILTDDEWKEVGSYYYSPDEQGKTPTYEDCLDFILDKFGVRFDSVKSVQRHIPRLDLKFSLTKRQLSQKLCPHYYSPIQINTFLNIVKVAQRKMNPYVIRFIEAKLRFEMEQQDLDHKDRFPYDMIQNAWIDLYTSLEVLGEYLEAQEDCLKLQDLIKVYRPWFWVEPDEISLEEWAKFSILKKFQTGFKQLVDAIKMATTEEYREALNRRNKYLRESKSVTINIVKKLEEKAYEMGIQTPVHLMEKDSLQVWIEELISRLPEPTKPKKQIFTLRNELKEYRFKKLNPDDYILWNVVIKVFEKAKTNNRQRR